MSTATYLPIYRYLPQSFSKFLDRGYTCIDVWWAKKYSNIGESPEGNNPAIGEDSSGGGRSRQPQTGEERQTQAAGGQTQAAGGTAGEGVKIGLNMGKIGPNFLKLTFGPKSKLSVTGIHGLDILSRSL